jgi:hypothetical protein
VCVFMFATRRVHRRAKHFVGRRRGKRQLVMDHR